MRIAHVTATFPHVTVGEETFVCYHNALKVAKRGHEVTIFTSDYPPSANSYPSLITVKRLPYIAQ